MKPCITIVIPSRTQPEQTFFLQRALRSIHAQTVGGDWVKEVIVGLDDGAVLPPALAAMTGLRVVNSPARSQVAALNAAVQAADSPLLAFLEDDDEWHPEYLSHAVRVIENGAAFVSSTQLEIDVLGEVVRINDFPTPAGWLMKASTWARVGPFDAEYRYHLDNDWLGRLAESGLERVHLVEATAPIHLSAMQQVRPWLSHVLTQGGPRSQILRHREPLPLVRRCVHDGSGMAQVKQPGAARQRALMELDRLRQRYGRVPW